MEDGYEGVLNNQTQAEGVLLSLGDRVTVQPDR
jgi:hypothetical protein